MHQQEKIILTGTLNQSNIYASVPFGQSKPKKKFILFIFTILFIASNYLFIQINEKNSSFIVMEFCN